MGALERPQKPDTEPVALPGAPVGSARPIQRSGDSVGLGGILRPSVAWGCSLGRVAGGKLLARVGDGREGVGRGMCVRARGFGVGPHRLRVFAGRDEPGLGHVLALGHKGLLPDLRTAVALAAGIEVPKLAETKRISWINLVFGIGSLIGIWAIIGVLADVVGSLDVIKGAAWGWVALAFVFAQLPIASNAMALAGAVTGQLPFGRCLGQEASNEFTQFVGGDVAAFAVRVRFFQREGYSPATALSSGAIASTASWVAKGALLLISLGFTAGNFAAPESSGGHHTAIWIVVGVVLAAGIATALISVIPRLRRLASARIRPQLAQIWADVKAIAVEPRKIAYVVSGSVLSQVFVALSLGAALHAVGERASIATLLVVITGAAIIGGAVPVPGGAGVIEAGLIAGLTAAGIPQDQAVAAVFIQRLCTAYLPPIWGWAALTWMRRHEYL